MPIPDSPALNRRQLLRSVGIAALALGALGATSACSSREVVTDGTAGGDGPITVVDQYDNTITFDTPVGRIVSTTGLAPELVTAPPVAPQDAVNTPRRRLHCSGWPEQHSAVR